MDLDRIAELDALSSYHKVALVDENVAAFLLVMSAQSEYKNDNYAWFATRYEKFLYIDRIVVSSEYAGYGIGARLYESLFEYARKQQIPHVTCEINIRPPNPVSIRFHEKMGFKEVGIQELSSGGKQVSMQVVEM